MWKLTSILALLFVTASGRYYPSRSSIKLKDDHDDPTVSSGKNMRARFHGFIWKRFHSSFLWSYPWGWIWIDELPLYRKYTYRMMVTVVDLVAACHGHEGRIPVRDPRCDDRWRLHTRNAPNPILPRFHLVRTAITWKGENKIFK